MTGEVLEMNKAIDTDKGRPQLINRDPLGKGWILKMKATGKTLIARVSALKIHLAYGNPCGRILNHFKKFENSRNST